MQRSPSLPLSAEGWHELYDAARGRRRVRLGADGTPRELELADGRRLTLTRDAVGNLRRIQAGDDFFLAIEPPDGHSPVLRVEDPAGQTEVRFGAGGRSQALRRGAACLELEWDGEGRLARVRLPGSSQPLVYAWRADGCCELGPEGGAPVLRISGPEHSRAFRFDGGGWDESSAPGLHTLTARGADGGALLSVRVELDLLGRPTARRWSDGTVDTFDRDASQRLARWSREPVTGTPETREYVYQGQELAEERGAGSWRRALDEAGRVRALVRPDGARVRYAYDAAGRRVEREDGAGVTRYRYDALGQLLSVERPDGDRVELTYDGLGRRLSRRGREGLRFEHRDADGRLWSITDEHGRALWTFLWWEDRLVARLDGPLGTPLAEAWLCEGTGTPLVAMSRDALGAARAHALAAPPFGVLPGASPRPSLYGHVGDAETGLIHCGARELDPELGLFLTPDPWHGGDDDPRRWGGASAAALRWSQELPSSGIHPYALCQFDPVGRQDRDGHVSTGTKVLRGLLTGLLAPTWGAPLTSISLFFFFPFNIWVEILGRITTLAWHLWPNNTIEKSTGFLGSSRQGAFAFGLNGFLPRVVSGRGFNADRAVTVGNVVWINRQELARLGRHRVIQAQAPAASPPPLQPFNADPAKHSILAVVGTDKAGKQWVHRSFWTRGFGNKVTQDLSGKQLMLDEPVDGQRRSSLHLARPLPLRFLPGEDTSPTSLTVREHLYDSTTAKKGIAQLDTSTWFALQAPSEATALKEKDLVEIAAPENKVPAAHRQVASASPEGEGALVVLTEQLPAHFTTPPITKDMKLSRVRDLAAGQTWQGWTSPGPNKLELAPAAGRDFPPALRKDADHGLVKVGTAVNADNTLQDAVSARIQSLQVKLTLAPPLTTAGSAGTDVVLLRVDRSFNATVPDVAKSRELKFLGSHPELKAGDLITVGPQAAPAGAAEKPVACARVEGPITAELFTVDLDLRGPLSLAGPSQVRVQTRVDVNTERDRGTGAAWSGNDVTVTVERTDLFKVGSFVRITTTDGKSTIRRVSAITHVALELTNAFKAGVATYVVREAELDPKLSKLGDVKQAQTQRLLKWTGGDRPSTFGTFPGSILGVHPIPPAPLPSFSPLVQEFFLQPDTTPGRAPPLHEDFRLRWKPLSVPDAGGTKDYWVLEQPLPLLLDDGGTRHIWRGDSEDHEGDSSLYTPPQNYTFELREFTATAALLQAPAHQVTSHPPEVQVPSEPSEHDDSRNALIEHELHHTVQCSRWGPLMTALPLQGLVMSTADIAAAIGGDMPDWYKRGASPSDEEKAQQTSPNAQMRWFDWFSIAGVMQLAWKYAFVWPARLWQGGTDHLDDWDYHTFTKYFSPLYGVFLSKLPLADKGQVGAMLGQLFSRAFDLRSWTPFTGFVPTLLPDGPKSFLEQGASRSSGDLYSTILTANDQYNFIGHTRLIDFVKDQHRADLKRQVGESVRLMLYPGHRLQSLMDVMGANTPEDLTKATLHYQYTSTRRDALTITMKSGTGLLHSALYKAPLLPAAATVMIDGPPSNATPVAFHQLGPGLVNAQPRPRALVPIPPWVSRTVGFYLLPASPGEYTITGEWAGAGDPDNDAGTHTATLTFSAGDFVKLDGAPVAWEFVISGAAPTTIIPRMATEKVTLKLESHTLKYEDPKNKGTFKNQWELQVTGPATAPEALADGWSFTLKKAAPAPAPAPVPVRVRLFRIVNPDDPIFDLAYDPEKAPTLKDVRSYLDAPIWLPVRDFHITIAEIPDPLHADAPVAPGEKFVLDLPIAVPDGALTVTRQDKKAELPFQKTLTGEKPPAPMEHGQRWHLTAPEHVEEELIYEVKVTFGTPPGDVVERKFLLTVKPAFRLVGKSGHDVRPGTPLELEVEGGTAPYTVEADPALPGLEISQPAANRIRLLARAAPENDTEVKITARDSGTPKKQGTRRVSVKKTPPFLLAVDSADALKYLRPQKQGLVTALINGRSSGGTGPDVNLTEPLDAMERAVKALGPGDFVYLSAWFFEPATLLTVGGPGDVKTWGKLLATKASEGVKVRLLLNDFDPVSGLDTWLKKKSLDPLKALVLELPKDKRDNLKYLVSLHPAHSGPLKAAAEAQKLKPIHIASHHQKFMVTKQGPTMKAFCGGLDIESRRTPTRWTSKANELRGWHDLHLRLEGPITRDLEQEFVLRWNRDRPGRRPLLEDWTPHEELALTPLTPEDQAEGLTKHPVQLVRTVSRHEPAQPFANERADIKEAYRRGIHGATKFLYLEGPHFRGPELADWIVAQGKAQPELVVLVVTGSVAGGKDHAVTQHGHHLQFTTFNRIITELGAARVKLFTLYNRAVHSKLILADDAWMMIGSANASARGLELDSALGLLVADPTQVAEFRARLWAHNLGETEATVKGWAPRDFLARWDAVAAANRLKLPPNKPQDMVGEGLISFDHLAMRGAALPGLPEAVTRLDLSPDGPLFEG